MGKLLRLERAAAPAVQVPGGTHGTFTLFSQAGGAALAADPTAYTMGVQFKVSTVGVNSATLTAVWFNSPAGAASLPGMIALYLVAGTVILLVKRRDTVALLRDGFHTPHHQLHHPRR